MIGFTWLANGVLVVLSHLDKIEEQDTSTTYVSGIALRLSLEMCSMVYV